MNVRGKAHESSVAAHAARLLFVASCCSVLSSCDYGALEVSRSTSLDRTFFCSANKLAIVSFDVKEHISEEEKKGGKVGLMREVCSGHLANVSNDLRKSIRLLETAEVTKNDTYQALGFSDYHDGRWQDSTVSCDSGLNAILDGKKETIEKLAKALNVDGLVTVESKYSFAPDNVLIRPWTWEKLGDSLRTFWGAGYDVRFRGGSVSDTKVFNRDGNLVWTHRYVGYSRVTAPGVSNSGFFSGKFSKEIAKQQVMLLVNDLAITHASELRTNIDAARRSCPSK